MVTKVRCASSIQTQIKSREIPQQIGKVTLSDQATGKKTSAQSVLPESCAIVQVVARVVEDHLQVVLAHIFHYDPGTVLKAVKGSGAQDAHHVCVLQTQSGKTRR